MLVAQGAVPAGPPPLASRGGPGARAAAPSSRSSESCPRRDGLARRHRVVLAAEILAGRRVGIRIEEGCPLLFFDLDTRELLRTRPNPLDRARPAPVRGVRPVGPPPRPSTEPITVQRRASNTGVIMVCGQKIALGRAHSHQTVTIHVSDTTLAVELDDGETRVIRRTTTLPVRNIKASRPRTATSVS